MREDKDIDRMINNRYIKQADLEWSLKEQMLENDLRLSRLYKEIKELGYEIRQSKRDNKMALRKLKKDYVTLMEVSDTMDEEFEELNS